MMLDTQSQSASIKEVNRPVVLSVEPVASKATKNSMCFETSILKSTKVTSLEL